MGGLNEKSKLEDFRKEFEKCNFKKSYKSGSSNEPSPIKIVWRPNNAFHALVLFDSLRESEEARYKMRARCLPHSSSEQLRIDYHDLNKLDPIMLRERSTGRYADSKR